MKRLGEYELLRKIGSGGMAEVWMGRRAAMAGASKAVAIKLLARDMLDDPAYRDMFIEEARLSMLLTNSNVVQVFDVGETDGEIYMVMEWIDGLNLSELARKMAAEDQRVDTVTAAHIVGEVLRGLAYAHGLHHEGSSATIVHRDVSPQNVLLSVSGEVKLADFGVARLAREETSGMHVKGKLRYMAPEQLRGRSREPTVDLYAVGAIMHELLTGKKFRQTRDEGDMYSMVLSGEFEPLGSEVPAELADLCERLLAPEPHLRIQSADEALERLYRWAGYRNASMEIGKLIRRWVGTAAPRSGIVSTDALAKEAAKREAAEAAAGKAAAVSTAASTAASPARVIEATSQLDTAPKPAADAGSGPMALEPTEVSGPSPMAAGSGPAAAAGSGPQGVAETRTWVASAPQSDSPTSPMLPASSAPEPASGTRLMMVLMTGAAVIAVAFGVLGLGFGLGWWGGGDEAVAAAEAGGGEKLTAEEAGDAEGDADVGVVAETDTGADGRLALADESGDESGGEVGVVAGDTGTETATDGGETGALEDSDESTGAEAETGAGDSDTGTKTRKPRVRKPPVDRTPADVKFKTGAFTFVWVKVKGKEYALQPHAEATLPPGRHTIYLRKLDTEPWIKVKKRLRLEPGKSYEVKMTKPAGFTVSEK